VFEHAARRRALALPNVQMVKGRVEGLVVGGDRRVVGVALSESDVARGRIDDAALVVDASGRTAQTPKWLEDAGFTPPAETLVNGFGGYASRYVHIPEDAWPSWWRLVAQLPLTRNTKGAVVYPQDQDLYVVSLFGQARDYPPGDEGGFDAFLAQCELPMARQMVLRSEPMSAIRTSRATANRWRHFEDLADPPVGYVAVGDAASTFNPMNGQGISTACLGVRTLEHTLLNVDFDLEKLTPEFQARLAERMQYPWRQAIGFDFEFAATVGDRPTESPSAAKQAAYRTAIGELSTVDVDVAAAAALSGHLFDPSLVRTPEIVEKVTAWISEGRTSPYTDPTVPPPGPDEPR
jgi:flavin-dependent dehydrogenase